MMRPSPMCTADGTLGIHSEKTTERVKKMLMSCKLNDKNMVEAVTTLDMPGPSGAQTGDKSTVKQELPSLAAVQEDFKTLKITYLLYT